MKKKIYFASDFHLGAPNVAESRIREERIVRWLDTVQMDGEELFLMGDIFDFWFEYREVIPKGFTRLFGKLAQMSDAGMKIYFFKGNHDMWVKDYFETELGIQIISDELEITRAGKTFYLHHGDGLGPGDAKYKFLRGIFRNPVCQWLFSILPPVIGLSIARAWSGNSRLANQQKEEFKGNEEEWLYVFAMEKLKEKPIDYFIFGHRHLPLDISLSNSSRYVNLGEWINYFSYAVFDGEELQLKYAAE